MVNVKDFDGLDLDYFQHEVVEKNFSKAMILDLKKTDSRERDHRDI